MRYNIRLTIKAIIRAEQMLGKPFTDFDYTDREELTRLLYCSVLANDKERMAYGTFLEVAGNEKQLSAMLSEMELENVLLVQFTDTVDKGEAGGSGDGYRMRDLASDLIVSGGLDPHYVMDELEISDIPALVRALDRRKREGMESQRLWTFLAVAPHIDTRKIRTVRDFYVFPWEVEERERKAAEEMDRNKGMFDRFMSGEFNHYLNDN